MARSRLYKAPRRFLRRIGRLHFARLVASLHPGCHQGPNRTALDRYPEIFAAAAAAAPDAQRILSFGCSTGEECVTLARYFPNAQIVGTDINPVNLLKARKHRSERIGFVYASDRILTGFGGFDAVFCMTVLRTWKRKRIAEFYPFDRFAERALFLESLCPAEWSSGDLSRDLSLRRTPHTSGPMRLSPLPLPRRRFTSQTASQRQYPRVSYLESSSPADQLPHADHEEPALLHPTPRACDRRRCRIAGRLPLKCIL